MGYGLAFVPIHLSNGTFLERVFVWVFSLGGNLGGRDRSPLLPLSLFLAKMQSTSGDVLFFVTLLKV